MIIGGGERETRTKKNHTKNKQTNRQNKKKPHFVHIMNK